VTGDTVNVGDRAPSDSKVCRLGIWVLVAEPVVKAPPIVVVPFLPPALNGGSHAVEKDARLVHQVRQALAGRMGLYSPSCREVGLGWTERESERADVKD
jgi:hypothetical protein